MVRNCKTEEPVWAKYITEENLPTDDLKFLFYYWLGSN